MRDTKPGTRAAQVHTGPSRLGRARGPWLEHSDDFRWLWEIATFVGRLNLMGDLYNHVRAFRHSEIHAIESELMAWGGPDLLGLVVDIMAIFDPVSELLLHEWWRPTFSSSTSSTYRRAWRRYFGLDEHPVSDRAWRRRQAFTDLWFDTPSASMN